MKGLHTHEKKFAAAKLHCQYSNPPFAFLEKVLSVFNEKDDKFFNTLEKYANCCSVCKSFNQLYPNL